MNFPTGTVTFLFTDIEGSTKLWEAQPEAMQAALARHDALLREAIENANGYVFKTVGDAFCAAFTTATDALEATLAAQLALLAEPWPEQTPIKVRMALHTGAVESRDGDYFGQPLNRVARLLATGHGGQSLLSLATSELMRDSLPSGAELRSLGEHRLKDLGRPEVVFQLQHPALPEGFPPLRSLDNPEWKHNLVLQATCFVGREKELREVRKLLQTTRLLTLVGAGGVGKTRLALQAGAEALDGTGEGVWVVELALLADPDLLAQSVARVFGVKEEASKPILQTLIERLKNNTFLLILDNGEHLLEACAVLAEALLRGCPRLQILATSREGLGIAGEQRYRVPPLSQSEAIQLFVERARLQQPDFTITERNAPALETICVRLDGIPLAIELAAARVRSLAPDQIAARLDDRLRLLVGGSRTALPRQQTLRAAIDWSYDLLSPQDQTLLQTLSLFRGGWCLEAAEVVCATTEQESGEILDRLTGLVDKSLVAYEEQQGTARYRLLETIRHYATEHFLSSGDSATLGCKHKDWFLALVEAAEPELKGPDQKSWGDRLEREHDNLRAALSWCREAPEGAQSGLRLAGKLWRFWEMRGHLREGQVRLQVALEHPVGQDASPARGDALNAAGILAFRQGEGERCRRFFLEALNVRRAIGDRQGAAMTLNNLGALATEFDNDPQASQQYFTESLGLFRELGDPWSTAYALGNLGVAARSQGKYEQARDFFRETLTIDRERGDLHGTAVALYNLGSTLGLMGEGEAGQTFLRESLAMRVEAGHRDGIAESLVALAQLLVTAEGGHSPLAAQLWGSAERLREEVGSQMTPVDLPAYEQAVAIAREALGSDAFVGSEQT